MTIKCASGIKRFQEDKNLGKWFNQLYPLVKSRESAQPEQAIEPSSLTRKNHKGNSRAEAILLFTLCQAMLSLFPAKKLPR